MYRLNVSYKQFYITLNEVWLFKVTQVTPVHAANLVANSGNTAYGVDVIQWLSIVDNNSLIYYIATEYILKFSTLRLRQNGCIVVGLDDFTDQQTFYHVICMDMKWTEKHSMLTEYIQTTKVSKLVVVIPPCNEVTWFFWYIQPFSYSPSMTQVDVQT